LKRKAIKRERGEKRASRIACVGGEFLSPNQLYCFHHMKIRAEEKGSRFCKS